MADREYVCAYKKYCLHHGEKVKASEAVVLGNKHYHWDCAVMKQEIQECVSTYMGYTDDKTKYPMVVKIINTLIFKHLVPVDFIKKNIETSKNYYSQKPVHYLYGIRKLFWEKEYKQAVMK